MASDLVQSVSDCLPLSVQLLFSHEELSAVLPIGLLELRDPTCLVF